MGKEITETKLCKLGKKEEPVRNIGDQKNLISKLDSKDPDLMYIRNLKKAHN